MAGEIGSHRPPTPLWRNILSHEQDARRVRATQGQCHKGVEGQSAPVVAREGGEGYRSHRGGHCTDQEDAPRPDAIGQRRAAHERDRIGDLEARCNAARRDAREADGEEPPAAARDEETHRERTTTSGADSGRAGTSHRKSPVAAAAPNNCVTMNPGASEGRMPAKVSEAARASVTAGFANDVEAVNQ